MGIFNSYLLGCDVISGIDDDFEVLGASTSSGIAGVQSAAARAQAAAAKLAKLKPAVGKKLASIASTMLASANKKAASPPPAAAPGAGSSSSAANPTTPANVPAAVKNALNSALNSIVSPAASAAAVLASARKPLAPAPIVSQMRAPVAVTTPVKVSVPAAAHVTAPAAARLVHAVRGIVGAGPSFGAPPNFQVQQGQNIEQEFVAYFMTSEQALTQLATAGEDLSGLLNIVNQLTAVNMSAGGTYQSQLDAGNAIVNTLSNLITGWSASTADDDVSDFQAAVTSLAGSVSTAGAAAVSWQNSVASIIASNPTAALTAQTTGTAWMPSTSYALGSQVTSGANAYRAVVAGTSGSVAPTATSGNIVDGTVTWVYAGAAGSMNVAAPVSQGPWMPNTYYAVGIVVSNQGSLYRCNVAGTSGQTGPYGNAATVMDGSITWAYAGADPNAMYDQANAMNGGGGDDGGGGGDDSDFGDDDSDDGGDDGGGGDDSDFDDSDDGSDGGDDGSSDDQEFDDVPASDLTPDDPNADMTAAEDGGIPEDDDADDQDAVDDGSDDGSGGYGAYVSPNLAPINIPWAPINFPTVPPVASSSDADASAPSDVSGALMGRARHHKKTSDVAGRGHKRDAVHGDDGAPAFTLPSCLPGVSDAAWTQFVVTYRGNAGVGDVGESNELGMFQLKPRRLADLGLMQNVSSTRAPNGRMLWVGNFVAPMTSRKFLSDPAIQYKTFCASMKKYVAGMKDGSVPTPDGGRPSDMSLSGALAILGRCGPSGIKTWNDVDNRFSETSELYDATNDIF